MAPTGSVGRRNARFRGGPRGVLLIAAICGLVVIGVGTWRLDLAGAVGQAKVTIRVQGGPDALAVTRDGEVWVADADTGVVEEFPEPGVGTGGGGERTIGSPDALVAAASRLIFYVGTDRQVSSIASTDLVDHTFIAATGGRETLALSPDGRTLYAASEDRDVVVAVNTATGHAGPPIAAGYEPVAMTLSPDGRTLYVADRLGYNVTVINTVSWQREKEISISGNPDALAISADGQWLYIANVTGDTVLVVSSQRHRDRSFIRVGRRPVAFAFTRNGRTLYVANNAGNTITPINTETRTAGTPIPVGSEPDALALTPDGRYLYVANFGDSTVSQLQLSNRAAHGD